MDVLGRLCSADCAQLTVRVQGVSTDKLSGYSSAGVQLIQVLP